MTTTSADPISAATSSEAPLITVVICTRNRAAQLRNVLESATRLRLPPDLSWELLVVDNGSSDGTAEVVRSFSSKLPIRLTREEVPGLSNARNRGVAEARGRYICWTDDDVIIDEGWLAAYAAAFKAHPDAIVFGGRITPVLEPPTPDWFARLSGFEPLASILARRDCADRPIPLDIGRGVIPWGANYAVRTAEQRQTPYDPDLGVSPLQKRLSEETDVIYRMLQGETEGWWAPDAQVRHMIPPHRQTLAYVFSYSIAHGETVNYLKSRPQGPDKSAGGRGKQTSWFSVVRSYVLAWLNGALFGLTWIVGAQRSGLGFLASAGYHTGTARYAAAGLRRARA
jgi:glycosyltransferase involved in cell wall biosynthesis